MTASSQAEVHRTAGSTGLETSERDMGEGSEGGMFGHYVDCFLR
jgi:hypothetical protein